MARTRLHLRLHPRTADGASTWISLSGPLPTKTARRAICRLIGLLATCSGEPLRVVLSAVGLADWDEAWRSALSHVPEHHRHVRSRARNQRRSLHTGQDGDEQLQLFGVHNER
jgi:hypothetical protein